MTVYPTLFMTLLTNDETCQCLSLVSRDQDYQDLLQVVSRLSRASESRHYHNVIVIVIDYVVQLKWYAVTYCDTHRLGV